MQCNHGDRLSASTSRKQVMGPRREVQTEYSRLNSVRIGNSAKTSPIFDPPILYQALVALMTSQGASQCAHGRGGRQAAGREGNNNRGGVKDGCVSGVRMERSAARSACALGRDHRWPGDLSDDEQRGREKGKTGKRTGRRAVVAASQTRRRKMAASEAGQTAGDQREALQVVMEWYFLMANAWAKADAMATGRSLTRTQDRPDLAAETRNHPILA